MIGIVLVGVALVVAVVVWQVRRARSTGAVVTLTAVPVVRTRMRGARKGERL